MGSGPATVTRGAAGLRATTGLRDPNFRGAPSQPPSSPLGPPAAFGPLRVQHGGAASPAPNSRAGRCPAPPLPSPPVHLLPRIAAGRARAAGHSRRADLGVGCGQAAHVAVAEPSVGRAAAAVGTGLSTRRRRSPLGPLHPAAAGHDRASPAPLPPPGRAAPHRKREPLLPPMGGRDVTLGEETSGD